MLQSYLSSNENSALSQEIQTILSTAKYFSNVNLNEQTISRLVPISLSLQSDSPINLFSEPSPSSQARSMQSKTFQTVALSYGKDILACAATVAST